MTIPFLSVKPRSIKLKVSPRFPAQLIGRAGIDVTKDSGNYYLDLDYADFPALSAVPARATYALVFDPVTNTYAQLPTSLLGATSGITDAPNDGTQYGRQSGAWTGIVGRNPATVAPLMDGVAAVGASLLYARQDHRHPTDTALLPLAGGAMTGPVVFSGQSRWLYSLPGSGGFYDTVTAANRFFIGSGDSDYLRIWAAGPDTDVMQIDGLTGAVNFPLAITAVTQAQADNSAKLATTAYVRTAIAGAVGNPTALIGLTAVNGSAVSAIRSDGAPALSQAIAPTWTGRHTFFGASRTGADTGAQHSFNVVNDTTTPGAELFFLPFTMNLTRTGGSLHRETLHCTLDVSGAPVNSMNAGAQFAAYGRSGSSGNIFGLNAYAGVYAGALASAQAVGFEANTHVETAVVAKVGVQIVDCDNSTGSGTAFDAGLVIGSQPGSAGFSTGIRFGFGNNNSELGIYSGGSLISCSNNTVAVGRGIVFEGMANFTIAPIVLAPGNKGIYWGSSKQGGAVVSETSVNGGDIALGNNGTGIRFGGTMAAFFGNRAAAVATTLSAQDTGGVFHFKDLLIGGADSGGPGFRMLRMVN